MDLEFSMFLEGLNEMNDAERIALECAVYIMKRAQELRPESRTYMVNLLMEIISNPGNP